MNFYKLYHLSGLQGKKKENRMKEEKLIFYLSLVFLGLNARTAADNFCSAFEFFFL